MKKQISDKQANLLRTIKRHGGTRIMLAVDMRSAKPLMRKGLLIAADGYLSLSDEAKSLLA